MISNADAGHTSLSETSLDRSKMPSTFRARLTYANVIATLALFIALGGTSIAAVSLSNNSVTSATIKDGEVKTADLAHNGVTTWKVADGTLTAADFASN